MACDRVIIPKEVTDLCRKEARMIAYRKILFDLPEKNLWKQEGHYYIKDGKARLVLPLKDGERCIPKILAREPRHKQWCQFHTCKLAAREKGHREYVASDALLLDEAVTSFTEDGYTGAYFFLTDNCLPFFRSLWRGKGVKKRSLRLDPSGSISLNITKCGIQFYSQEKQERSSLVMFQLLSKETMKMKSLFPMLEAVAGFYSLFCSDLVGIGSMRLRLPDGKWADYWGNKISGAGKDGKRGRMILTEEEIRDPIPLLLAQWIKEWQRYAVPMKLLRDAVQTENVQLRFLCLTRCLEIFHYQFFLEERASRGYFDNLQSFALREQLGIIPATRSAWEKAAFVHRVYDLVRHMYGIISVRSFRPLFRHLLGFDAIQTLVDSRNYYTHFGYRRKIWEPEELEEVNRELLLFIRVLLFRQAGFENETIRLLMERWKDREELRPEQPADYLADMV